MKFSFKDIRPLSQGDIKLNKLTILCGENNTGKTYVTNTIYSFLDTWEEHITWEIPEFLTNDLYKNGAIKVDLKDLIVDNFENIKLSIIKKFTEKLPEYLACSDKVIENANFDFHYNIKDNWINNEVKSGIKNYQDEEFLTVNKEKDSIYAEILLKKTSDGKGYPLFIIKDLLTKILVQIVIVNIPNTFIASAERTGAAIFKNELNFGRNQLINYLAEMDSSSYDSINPFELASKFKRNYAHSVVKNVEFISNLSEIENKGKSGFIEKNPTLIEDFIKISGGEYKASEKGGIFFHPSNSSSTLELGIGESSSTVRALMLIWYWLNYVASENSLLIIDEPELNLHPANQRRFARFLVSLVNSGVSVFITTHSDYIIREMNTLILMSNETENTRLAKERYGYRNDECLSYNDVNIYISEIGKKNSANNVRLRELEVTMNEGIVIKSFDNEVREINKIQESLLYGFN